VKEANSTPGQSELAIELEHVVEGSQWLMAGVVCDNDALAHTTPVYVVVNGRPTWNARLGPAIIDKQLAAIARIESELVNHDDARSAGLRERFQHARVFYADLREGRKLQKGK